MHALSGAGVKPSDTSEIQTSSEAERVFINRAKFRGWQVMRNGWPDFMLTRKNENGVIEFQAVEVKNDHDNDELRATQRLMIAALVLQGIPCSVWSMETQTLRKVERLDAQAAMDELFSRVDQEKTRDGLKKLRDMGVLVRYDL